LRPKPTGKQRTAIALLIEKGNWGFAKFADMKRIS
jgi:hypothetical protein